MTSGRHSAALLLWCAAAAAEAPAPPADADALLAALVREPPSTIPFLEFRRSELLEGELVVRGTLEYSGPGALARIVTAPYQERTEIRGEQVTIRRPERPERRFSLRRAPEMRGLLTGFRALLTGDREALEREFELSLRRGETAWELTLVPRAPDPRIGIGAIRVRGEGEQPYCIVTARRDQVVLAEQLLGEAATAPEPAQQRARHCGAPP